MSADRSAARFRILCVCTGNVYRSRIAAATLRAGLLDRLGATAADFDVTSVGTQPGGGVTPDQVAACLRHGWRIEPGPVRSIDAQMVDAAGLVLCAAGVHRAAVLELVPAALRRSFLLSEFGRLAVVARTRTEELNLEPIDRARAVVAIAAQLRGTISGGRLDDIPDPWGRPEGVLVAAGQEIESAVSDILDGLTERGSDGQPVS